MAWHATGCDEQDTNQKNEAPSYYADPHLGGDVAISSPLVPIPISITLKRKALLYLVRKNAAARFSEYEKTAHLVWISSWNKRCVPCGQGRIAYLEFVTQINSSFVDEQIYLFFEFYLLFRILSPFRLMFPRGLFGIAHKIDNLLPWLTTVLTAFPHSSFLNRKTQRQQ